MSALIIIDLSPTNKEKLSIYSPLAAETLVPYGGEFIAKGSIETLHGSKPYQTKVIIQFPDQDSAVSWYESAAYQALIPIRDQGMESQFHLVG